MSAFYSNHLCAVGKQGRAAGGGVNGRIEERLVSPGRKRLRREWEVLAASAKPHAACVIVAPPPVRAPPSSPHARSPTPISTCTHCHLTSVTFELRRDPNEGEQNRPKFSSYLIFFSAHFQIEIIKAQTESHLNPWTVTVKGYISAVWSCACLLLRC